MDDREMRNRWFSTKPKPLQYYKRMLIQADTGIHDQAMALFKKYVPVKSRVLDLGAGTGAFSKKLADEGYSVISIDADRDRWIPKEIPFIQQDIEAGIESSIHVKLDAVCCLEVIEHVENPWNLLREISKILEPRGVLILSTPNITSFLSRIVFLRTGKFHQFNEADLSYGHIRPVTAFEISTIAKKLGWRILEIKPGGYLPIFDFGSIRPKPLILNLLRGLSYLLAKGQKEGWCLFFVMKWRDE